MKTKNKRKPDTNKQRNTPLRQEDTETNLKILRKIINTGYSEGGASHRRQSMAAWNPVRSSAKSDIDSNTSELRGRSADLYMNSPIASSAISTSRTQVIGAGLNLSAKCKYKLLGISAEEGKAWNKKTMEEFDLWASSKYCDLYRKNNWYDLQDIAYMAYMIDGDSWALFKYREPMPLMPYSLRLQVFEAARVCNPNASSIFGQMSPYNVETKNPKNGNRIINGVEIDSDGAIVAYWVANRVPYDPTEAARNLTWQRVEAYGKKTGEPNILQIAHDERPEQFRGVPYLAPVIETLKQVTRFSEAELMSAIIKSFFTLFFTESYGGGDGLDGAVQETIRGEDRVSLDPNDIELGPAMLNCLPAGYDVKQIDAGRNLSTFNDFTTHLIRQIGAALEIPYEVLMKSFTSSYSAARAALLQGWAVCKIRRIWFVRDLCQPVYERWLAEAVAIGRIKAPGFFDDPLIRKAWCNAEWYGPVMGMIDPEKEANAANLRIQYGFSNREKESAEQTGINFDENIDQLADEQRRIAENGVHISSGTAKGGEKEDEKVLEDQQPNRDERS